MGFLPIHRIILLCFCSSTLLPPPVSSDSRLLPNKPLTVESTLISDDGTFALGFFSPSNSTQKHFYYVGIWYNNIPKDNVMWVANRATPVTDPSSATLALTNTSNLVLSSTSGQMLWTANISSASETTAGEARLDNTGNFILRTSEGVVLWQSFDYPADTLLPGMKLRVTHNRHALQRLVSWKGPQDPTPGSFSYGADPNEFLQRFIWNGSRPYWRSPVWNNYLVVGPYMGIIKSTIYFTVSRDDGEIYMSFGIPGGSSSSTVIKIKMDYSGKIEILTWNSNILEWDVVEAHPNHECSTYGYCGPFGYCDNTEPNATCKCLDSFEPISNKGRSNGRFPEGCRRKETLRCGEENTSFLTLTTMKIPDKFMYVKNRSFDECTAECASNCSCTGYAYANLSTTAINGDDTRCLLWMGDLIDTEKRIRGRENLYIRVNRSSDKKRRSNILKITLPVVSSLLILVFMWLVWICNSRVKQRNKKTWKKIISGVLNISDELGDGKLPSISFREIVLATNNFSSSNMLGHGGFGHVYKGTLECGKTIAVKRLSKGSGQGVLEFRNEVILIAKLQHRNLVKLLGFCIHGDEKLLIYEYLSNKSLDAFLFNSTRKPLLDWSTRFNIILGIARGILYLHQDSRLKIIHRDLKASNILLDDEMSPKISDFGMARIFYGNQQQGNTNRVVGTYGYMSPEYALEGVFSVKSDVYSFGVLVLEIVSGSKISSMHMTEDYPNLIACAWSLWRDGNAKEFVDSSIVDNCSLDETSQCIHIGLLCVQDSPNARPLMSSIVSILENGDTSLPPPKQPIYFAERNYGTDGAAEAIVNSANTTCVTALEGR
ncbi:G-type lectin S-receptor-like serine/threonine-protein kinase B120 [Miscanthus floridulus]|uniref:G-type lectin S-receptor-like serine/threonine-protein kinase B120 n=1 Tax=Miscanthus floridulus TaxID=154761 RepID=UPI0034587C30